MELPNIADTRPKKILFFFILYFLSLVLYQITNRYSYLTPQVLKFTFVDNFMPFWSWTVWIYFTEYVMFSIAYFGLSKSENVSRYFYAYITILVTSIIVFMIYPVTYPRENFPVLGNSFSDHAVIFLREYMDKPTNCLPSLHVSSCYISSICFWSERRKLSIFLMAWSTLVALSTMMTKQHYWVDVLSATILMFAAYFVYFLKVKIKN